MIRSIIVDVIAAVETIFGAVEAAAVVKFDSFDGTFLAASISVGFSFFDFSLSRDSKSLESTRGDARDREGVVPLPEVAALRGVVLLVVVDSPTGVVGSSTTAAEAAAARRVGV